MMNEMLKIKKSKLTKNKRSDEDDDESSSDNDTKKSPKKPKPKPSKRKFKPNHEKNKKRDEFDDESSDGENYNKNKYKKTATKNKHINDSDYSSDEYNPKYKKDKSKPAHKNSSDDSDSDPRRKPTKTKQYEKMKNLPSSNSYLSKTVSSSNDKNQKNQHKCDSDLKFDSRTKEGRKIIAKQTIEIIKHSKTMGKYTIRTKDNKIEKVDISTQIINSYHHSHTYNQNYLPKLPNNNNNINQNQMLYQYNYSATNQQTNNLNLLLQQCRTYNSPMCKFEVVNDSSLGAARNLVQKNRFKTCILNFASPSKPDLAFFNGQQSQENSFLRQTSLYSTLKDSQMYRDNSSLSNNMYSDSMVYSSRVPVFRSPFYERLF